jgi:hypothetical protein
MAVAQLMADWQAALATLREAQASEPQRPYEAATDLLQVTALLLLGYAWLRAARVSRERSLGTAREATARFFFRRLFPEAQYRLRLGPGLTGAGGPERSSPVFYRSS